MKWLCKLLGCYSIVSTEIDPTKLIGERAEIQEGYLYGHNGEVVARGTIINITSKGYVIIADEFTNKVVIQKPFQRYRTSIVEPLPPTPLNKDK